MSLASGVPGPDYPGMKRLIAGSLLWFLSFWFMYELVWSLTGLPRIVGPVIGLAVAATVWIDPMHWFWPVRTSRSIAGMRQSTALRPLTK